MIDTRTKITETVSTPDSSVGEIFDDSFLYLIPRYLDYAEIECGYSPETIAKYKESLNWAIRYMNDMHSPTLITKDSIMSIKKQMRNKNLSASRINSLIFALRGFLNYCIQEGVLVNINPKDINPMKIPNRQVDFLRPEEIKQFLDSMNMKDIRGLRMRTLCEILLATGMRISECLSINKEDIDWGQKEILILGKGNKQRTVFLSDRAIHWLQAYLIRRKDNNPALFVTFGNTFRLKRHDLSKQFKRYALKAGLKSKLHPHTLRHTMATTMLHNGGDIMFIKDLLGHSDIQTTAKYYLGTDKRALKDAHLKYLKYE